MKTIEEYLNLLPGSIMFPVFDHRVAFIPFEEWGEDEPFSPRDHEMVWSENKYDYRLLIHKDSDNSWHVSYVSFGPEGGEYLLPLYPSQIEEMKEAGCKLCRGGIHKDSLQEALFELWEWLQDQEGLTYV